MDRVVDIAVLLALGCALGLAGASPEGAGSLVVAFLASLIAAAMAEVGPGRIARGAACAVPLAAALVDPAFSLFAAVGVYTALAAGIPMLAALWAVALIAAWPALGAPVAVGAAALALLAAGTARRTARRLDAEVRLREMRDDLQEEHLALAARTRDLRERQDLEVRCAVLDERGRIAREIHDNVGHLLTRAVLQTEALAVTCRDDEERARDVEAVGETLHEALDTVRRSVHDLHDDAFDGRTALEEAVGSFTALAGSLHFEAETLPRDVALAAVAIVREALTNAAVHGRAAHATVRLVEFPGFYQLTVEDDGCPRNEGAGAGLGLASMRERACALGGTFSFSRAAAPGTGGRVFASFPKTQEAAS